MASLNKVYPDRQPHPRSRTAGHAQGHAICQFGLAMNRQFKMSPARRVRSDYVDIEAWGKQGETIAKYCTKGRPLYVEGRLRLDQWEDKNTVRSAAG
jgi:single-strand DNA-binding protein